MVEKTTLKIFLTSGVTLTVGEDETLWVNGEECDLHELYEYIVYAVSHKALVTFTAKIKHQFKDYEEHIQIQPVTHDYVIPYDRISWFMVEEV